MNRGRLRKRAQKSVDSPPRAGRIAHKTVHSCWRRSFRSGEEVAGRLFDGARKTAVAVVPILQRPQPPPQRSATARPLKITYKERRMASTLNRHENGAFMCRICDTRMLTQFAGSF